MQCQGINQARAFNKYALVPLAAVAPMIIYGNDYVSVLLTAIIALVRTCKFEDVSGKCRCIVLCYFARVEINMALVLGFPVTIYILVQFISYELTHSNVPYYTI